MHSELLLRREVRKKAMYVDRDGVAYSRCDTPEHELELAADFDCEVCYRDWNGD